MIFMWDYIVCDNCGYEAAYDKESTLYLKCPYCNNVLVDEIIDERWLYLQCLPDDESE